MEMQIKKITVVTHGDKGIEFDPEMTFKGFAEVHPLRRNLPQKPTKIVTGIGRRQKDVAKALGLIPGSHAKWAGDGDSLIVRDGQKFILRADGTEEKSAGGNFTPEEISAAIAGIIDLPSNAVVCAGRPVILMLGVNSKDATSASVFEVTVADGEIVKIVRTACNDGVIDPALQ